MHHRLLQTRPIGHRLVAGGLVCALLLVNWTFAAAQRARRQPARAVPSQGPAAAVQSNPLPLPAYFPADTLLYIELERVTEAIDEVLATENLQNFLTSGDSPLPIDLNRYDEALVAFGLPDKATIAATRFGLGLTLAPSKNKDLSAASTLGGLPAPDVGLMLVVIAPDEAAATRYVELGQQWLPSFVTNAKRTKPVTERVGSFQTMTFLARNANDSLLMARSGRVIVFGLSPFVRRWLTQFNRPGFTSLESNKGFERLQQQLVRPRNGFMFINTAAGGASLRQLLGELLLPRSAAKSGVRERTKAEPELTAKLNQLVELSGIGTLDGIGCAYRIQDRRIVQQIVVGADRSASGLYPALIDGPRVSGYAANFLPDETEIFATISVNPTRVYDTLRQMAGVWSSQYETDVQVAERKFGVNFRQEIAAALTGEMSLALSNLRFPDVTGFGMRLPRDLRVAAFAVSNNPQALRDAFAKIFSFAARKAADRRARQATAKSDGGQPPKPVFQPRIITYEGETIWLFEGSNDDEEAAFAVAVVASTLVAGRTTDVKWVIDSYQRGQTLGRQEDFNVGFGARPADAMGGAYVSQAFLAKLLEALRAETPKRYQPFLESLTAAPFFTCVSREERTVSHTLDFPLSSVIGLGGASYGVSAAADERLANEQAVRDVLRAIYEAQMAYARGAGKGAYTDSLATLAVKPDGSRAFAEDVELMTRLPYRGYILGPIKLRPAGGETSAGFSVRAFPAVRTGPDRTGNQTYYLDETGTLRCRGAGSPDADADSPPCGSFVEETSPDNGASQPLR